MDAYYRRSPTVAGRIVEGEAVLVKMPEGLLHVLNPSASRLWVTADGVRPLTELVELPGGGEGEAVEAARAFLERLVDLGLMERADRPRAAADVYPQEVEAMELAPSSAPPAVRATGPVETLAGPSCSFSDFPCGIPST
jgi:hypothetical protein